jgi:hypothetical protein
MDKRYSPIVDMYGAVPDAPSPRGKDRFWLYVLLTIVSFFAIESIRPVMRLRPTPPPSVVGNSLSHDGDQIASQQRMARGCWDYAITSLQNVYPYGSDLPRDPPPRISHRNGTSSVVSALCWPRLRVAWTQSESWVRSYEWSTDWATNPRSPFRQAIHNALNRVGIA